MQVRPVSGHWDIKRELLILMKVCNEAPNGVLYPSNTVHTNVFSPHGSTGENGEVKRLSDVTAELAVKKKPFISEETLSSSKPIR